MQSAFLLTLTNVLVLVFYMIPGFIVRKTRLVSEKGLSTVAGILIYCTTPFLVMSAFIDIDFSLEMLGNLALFFAVTLVIQAAFIAIIALIFRKKFEDARYRILCIASAMGNVGYFGIPIVRAIFPEMPEAFLAPSVPWAICLRLCAC